jgi:hypothetical protein
VQREAERQHVEGGHGARLAPIQDLSITPKNGVRKADSHAAYRARQVTQLQRFAEGMELLFAKYAKLGQMRLGTTRDELRAPGSDERDVLHRWAVRVLNVIELHLMELFSIPQEQRTQLMTPLHAVQATSPAYMAMCDEGARGVCAAALEVRASPAVFLAREARLAELCAALVAPGNAVDEADGRWADLAERLAVRCCAEEYEEMFAPFIGDDVLQGVRTAAEYHTRVLLPLLRHGGTDTQ